jgi:hypothetical protein
MASKQALRKTEQYRHTLNYKMTYPGPEAYHFPAGTKHESPCMSEYWRSQPIRQGKKKEE